MSEQLIAQLQRHEGLRLTPYRCTAGVLTIGYGRNLEYVGITADEARSLLMNDVFRVRLDLSKRLACWHQLDPVRRDVLVNMAFNLGVGGLLTFTNTLRAVQEARWEDAAAGMLASKWAAQVKGRAVELAEQMRTGRYQ